MGCLLLDKNVTAPRHITANDRWDKCIIVYLIAIIWDMHSIMYSDIYAWWRGYIFETASAACCVYVWYDNSSAVKPYLSPIIRYCQNETMMTFPSWNFSLTFFKDWKFCGNIQFMSNFMRPYYWHVLHQFCQTSVLRMGNDFLMSSDHL